MSGFIERLLSFTGKKNAGLLSAIRANLITALVFVVIVPLCLYWLGLAVIALWGDISIPKVPAWFNITLAVIGLSIRIWSSYVHYTIGKGTPLYTNPTKQLIVMGPYRYTRNPIMLGMMLYYLSVSLFFGSAAIFITVFILPSLFGNLYHKFIEEKELRIRFGSEYLEYKSKVPFLIPSLKRTYKS